MARRRRRGAATPFNWDRRKKYGFVSHKDLKQAGCATVALPILPLLEITADYSLSQIISKIAEVLG